VYRLETIFVPGKVIAVKTNGKAVLYYKGDKMIISDRVRQFYSSKKCRTW